MVPSLYWRTRLFGERGGWYVFIIISRKRLKREKVCCMFLKTSALRVSMDLSNIIRALVDVEHLVSAAKEVTTKRETGHTHTQTPSSSNFQLRYRTKKTNTSPASSWKVVPVLFPATGNRVRGIQETPQSPNENEMKMKRKWRHFFFFSSFSPLYWPSGKSLLFLTHSQRRDKATDFCSVLVKYWDTLCSLLNWTLSFFITKMMKRPCKPFISRQGAIKQVPDNLRDDEKKWKQMKTNEKKQTSLHQINWRLKRKKKISIASCVR